MKLLSFIRTDGTKSYGLHTNDGIVDLGKRLGDKYNDIKSLLAADAMKLAQAYQHESADYRIEDVTFLPIIEAPQKIICVGMNYMAKRQEFEETNQAPTLFIRFPDSQTGHACRVVKPRISNEFDTKVSWRSLSVNQANISLGKTPCHMLQATVAIWMAQSVTGSIHGLLPEKTGKKPVHSAHGW